MKSNDGIFKHFRQHSLCTAKTIANMGTKDMDTLLKLFPKHNLTDPDFLAFVTNLCYLAESLKEEAEEMKEKDTTLAKQNPSPFWSICQATVMSLMPYSVPWTPRNSFALVGESDVPFLLNSLKLLKGSSRKIQLLVQPMKHLQGVLGGFQKLQVQKFQIKKHQHC